MYVRLWCICFVVAFYICATARCCLFHLFTVIVLLPDHEQRRPYRFSLYVDTCVHVYVHIYVEMYVTMCSYTVCFCFIVMYSIVYIHTRT